jgi:hypothetical protein
MADLFGAAPALSNVVASFACPCGFRDEVFEPVPDRIDCRECKRRGAAERWYPKEPAPPFNARRLP